MATPDIDAVCGAFADLIASLVVQKLQTGALAGYVDQAVSPLGPRRHRAAVLRRIAAGQPGAAKIGRRHLLSRDALEAELAAAADKAPASPSVADELRRELRLVGR